MIKLIGRKTTVDMCSESKGKPGSSRVKGDEYQDLVALKLLIDLYLRGGDFSLVPEHTQVKAFDDIVIFEENRLRAIQVKLSVHNLGLYEQEDFFSGNKRVDFKSFAAGWIQLRSRYPEHDITVELYSNYTCDSNMGRVIDADGRFTKSFIEGTVRGPNKRFRERLKEHCKIDAEEPEAAFEEFLRCFKFSLGQRNLSELKTHVLGELLSHRLGIEDQAVYHKLLSMVLNLKLADGHPITRASLDQVLGKTQRRYLLPQHFPVESDLYVENETFSRELRRKIEAIDSGYIVTTGLPGSGKSTCLSRFFDDLELTDGFETCRYYCFTHPDDTARRKRLRAETFRVNLLSDLRNQFPHFSDRTFDYTEDRLPELLSELSGFLISEGLRLVILIDGLDHDERDQSVRETILSQLPETLPERVTIVVGTQELRDWTPLALKRGRSANHVAMPCFSLDETKVLLRDRLSLNLSEDLIGQVHAKSRGLPLYLRYIATNLSSDETDAYQISEMPDAVDGDIRLYYERLWDRFEQYGQELSAHVCKFFAVLRFPVTSEEIGDFLPDLSNVDHAKSLKSVRHLLGLEGGKLSVFHDSFRTFVQEQMDVPMKRGFCKGILSGLKREEGSPRWFEHAFYYADQAGDIDYLLETADKSFISKALLSCRPREEISESLQTAILAAVRNNDLISLARLSSLHYRFHDCVQSFEFPDFVRAYLAINPDVNVVDLCFGPRERRWLVDEETTEQVLLWCASSHQLDHGKALIKLWSGTRKASPSAAVLGVYSTRPIEVLKWVARSEHSRDILERRDTFLPGYNPSLESFLEGRFRFCDQERWQRYKRIKRLCSNHLVRHILLRLVARYKGQDLLAAELDDYIAHTPESENLEVAGYAVFAQLPVERVRALAGDIELPPNEYNDSVRRERLEADLDRFEWTSIVLGYEGDTQAIKRAFSHLGTQRSVYAGFLRFMLRSGVFIGGSLTARYAEDDERYGAALAAIEELTSAGADPEAREMDTLRACRPMIARLLTRLTDYVSNHTHGRLDDWRDRLIELRQGGIWKRHWGVGESQVDYRFELDTWDSLRSVKGMATKMQPILASCAETYAQEAALKASSRSQHFLGLAQIAAECDFRADAARWHSKAASCVLTYGYRKDVTLDYLVDTLELLCSLDAQDCRANCAEILELVKWMHDATDGSATSQFEQSVFRVLLANDEGAALRLLRFFNSNVGRWNTLDCLEQYCLAAPEVDAEVLWTLKDVFVPHTHDEGYNSKQVVRAVMALSDYRARTKQVTNDQAQSDFTQFVRSTVDPRWWPESIWSLVQSSETRDRISPVTKPSSFSSPKETYTLEERKVNRSEIEALLAKSIDTFAQVFEKLKAENAYFHEDGIICAALDTHIDNARSGQELMHVGEVIENIDVRVFASTLLKLSNRFYDFGETERGRQSLNHAYKRSTEWEHGSADGRRYLKELCSRDPVETRRLISERCEVLLSADHGGHDVPRMIARYFFETNDLDSLRAVFGVYLTSCQDLFEAMPTLNEYGWLNEPDAEECSREELIVNFLIDIVGEPEINRAHRVLRSLANLAKSRAEIVCKITCLRIAEAEPLLRERLEMLLESLASLCPSTLSQHIDVLSPLAGTKHFRLRMVLKRVFTAMKADAFCAAKTKVARETINRSYSSRIAYPNRRTIHLEPSNEFIEFIKNALPIPLMNQLLAVSYLLGIEDIVVLGHLERALNKDGWTIEQGKSDHRNDWEYNVNRGRIVLIASRFQVRFSELLQGFIHEVLESGRFGEDVITHLERVFRTGDPDYILSLPSPKPSSVPALHHAKGADWIEELENTDDPRVVEPLSDGWTTLREKRILSCSDGNSSRLRSVTNVYSLLVSPEWVDKITLLPPDDKWVTSPKGLWKYASLSSKEVQEVFKTVIGGCDILSDVQPLLCEHRSVYEFLGFETFITLHPVLINRFGLTVEGTSVLAAGDCVARSQEWQEGYEDDPSSRELLSRGFRFIARNDWLKKVLKESEHALVIRSRERRGWYDSYRERKPSKTSTGINTRIFVEV